MNYKIKMTAEAEADLRSIFKYIAVNLQSVMAAAGQLERLEKAVNSLGRLPERYRVYEKEPWRSRNLRIMPVDNYLVFYIPDNEEYTVIVMRIMYGACDIDSKLGVKYSNY